MSVLGKKLGLFHGSLVNKFMVTWSALQLALEDWVRISVGRLLWRKPNDLVSFPIATYDRAGILVNRTIPSILGQTYPNIEVIVVADGSSETELSRLRAIEDSRVKIFRLRKRTKYPTDTISRWMVAGWRPRNVGVRKSRGDWVYWISDDDVLLPHAVQELLALAKNGGYESVSGAFQQGTKEPKISLPSEGLHSVGFHVTGPPAWLSRRYIGKLRWNRHSWRKNWNRPSDYDLMKRMQARGVLFGHTEELVAIQPEVDGTGKTGLEGALAASSE